MNVRLGGAGFARRALSVIAGTVVVVLVAAVAPADASVTIDEFATPTPNSSPGGITVGPDGNVWFTQAFSISTGLGSIVPDRIGTPAFGTNYSSGTNFRIGNVTTGSNGNLWFTIMGSPYNEIGEMTPAGAVIHRWTISGWANNAVPPDIVAGPDNNLWFTEANCRQLGQITTAGTLTTFSIPIGAQDIAAGPDKNVWFTGSQIGSINPTTGNVTMYQPSATSIAPSPCEGSLWFTRGNSVVGKISTSGAFSDFLLPTANSNPDDITAASNGTVFLTEPNGKGGQIARAVDSASLLPCVMLLANDIFTFPLVNLSHQGLKSRWMSLAPGTHGVADASGMKLFGFSASNGLPTPVPIGTTVTFQFNWAGTFPYDDPFHAAAPGGQVSVPIKVAPLVGAPGASVTWASGAAPPGFGFDVQVKPPGGADWITWQSGVTSLSAPFGPNDPLWAGPGTYQFQARLRQLSSNAASGYSAPKSITIS